MPFSIGKAFSKIRLWLSTALGALLLVLAFRGVQLPELLGGLAQANYGFIILALGTVIMTTLAKAVRWRLLFYPHHHGLRYNKLFSVLLIGQMINITLPGRLGELARAYFLGEIEKRSKASILGTIILEKLLDMFMLLVLLIAFLPFIIPLKWLREPGTAVATATIAFLFVTLILAYQRDRATIALRRLLRLLPKPLQVRTSQQLELALSNLEILRHGNVILQVSGWSVLIWLLAALTNYLAFLALGLRLSFLAAVFLLMVLHIGIAVPSSPGKVGVFHYLCILALSVFSVERSMALSYGVVLHVIVFLPLSLLGAFSLWWENLSLRKLEQARLEVRMSSEGSP